jgi:hypothetical protein
VYTSRLGFKPGTEAGCIDGSRRYELADLVCQVGAVLEPSGCHPGRPALDHLRILTTGLTLCRVWPSRRDQEQQPVECLPTERWTTGTGPASCGRMERRASRRSCCSSRVPGDRPEQKSQPRSRVLQQVEHEVVVSASPVCPREMISDQ